MQALRLCRGRTAHRGSRGIALPFHDRGTRRGEGSASRPGRSLPPGKTRYPLYRRLGGPQGRSGLVRKISPPPGLDPRTFQPVASRYTGYATRSTTELCEVAQSKRQYPRHTVPTTGSPCHATPPIRLLFYSPSVTSLSLCDLAVNFVQSRLFHPYSYRQVLLPYFVAKFNPFCP